MSDPAGGGLTVTGIDSVRGAAAEMATALADDVPARLLAKDPTLWGPEAEAEASIRLGWIDLHRTSRGLVDELAALRAELVAEGLDHVLLAGMGGSSLAPEVIARTLGVDLTVVDTTDPHQIRAVLADADRLRRTVAVVSSKSGGTVETDSHRRAFQQAFLDLGLSEADAGRRFVIVTDPGSPLVDAAAEMGARAVFLADENVGGRYSALTAFGLVPAALAGVDVGELLDEAAATAATLGGESPALALGAAIGAAAKAASGKATRAANGTAARAGRDKLVLAEDGSGIVGLGDWAEQLVAESTGKNGRGVLPVVIETPTSVGTDGEDVLLVTVGGALRPDEVPGGGAKPDLTVNGPLGGQFLAWEYATAVAGRILQINPFDQPNVAESKENTNRILAAGLPSSEPAFVGGAIEVHGSGPLLAGASDVAGAVRAVLEAIPPHGYLAVLAYLDRFGDAAAARLRPLLAARTRHAVTFGWGPRFLHSTGQYHKGGPQSGAFLQITGAVVEDLPVPGKPYSFGALQAAQAAGDLEALAGRGRPVLRLHLTDRVAGLEQLVEALR